MSNQASTEEFGPKRELQRSANAVGLYMQSSPEVRDVPARLVGFDGSGRPVTEVTIARCTAQVAAMTLSGMRLGYGIESALVLMEGYLSTDHENHGDLQKRFEGGDDSVIEAMLGFYVSNNEDDEEWASVSEYHRSEGRVGDPKLKAVTEFTAAGEFFPLLRSGMAAPHLLCADPDAEWAKSTRMTAERGHTVRASGAERGRAFFDGAVAAKGDTPTEVLAMKTVTTTVHAAIERGGDPNMAALVLQYGEPGETPKPVFMVSQKGGIKLAGNFMETLIDDLIEQILDDKKEGGK